MAEKRADEISIEIAARLIMLSPERVRQLIKSGHVERTRPGFTTIPSVVQGYIKFLKESASDKTQNASASRAQDARAREIDLRIAKEMRTLIPQEEAALAMSQVVGAVTAEIAGLPARVTRDLAQRRKIEVETHGAQSRIATALEKLLGALASGETDS